MPVLPPLVKPAAPGQEGWAKKVAAAEGRRGRACSATLLDAQPSGEAGPA